MFKIAEAQAAEFFLDGNAVQPQSAHFWPELPGKGIGGINFRSDRGDAVCGEPSRRFAYRVRDFA